MIVDDDFLGAEEVSEIKNFLLSSNFPWFLNEETSPKTLNEVSAQTIHEGFSDGFQFTHNIYQDHRPQSNYFDNALEIFNRFCIKNNIFPISIIRAKINFTSTLGKKLVYPAHVDYTYDHKVFIYYVNDSDGDTILYDQNYNENMPKNLTVAKKISPKAGRGIVFNGLNYHSASLPVKNKYRVLINICFI